MSKKTKPKKQRPPMPALQSQGLTGLYVCQVCKRKVTRPAPPNATIESLMKTGIQATSLLHDCTANAKIEIKSSQKVYGVMNLQSIIKFGKGI